MTRHAVLKLVAAHLSAKLDTIKKGDAPYWRWSTAMNCAEGENVVEVEYMYVGCEN